jgi:basic amino acid/polyamine antiporter, APA family
MAATWPRTSSRTGSDTDRAFRQNVTGSGLQRRLGLTDAVVIGLGSMIGAGVFAALGPAAAAAGPGLLAGLALAAIVAYCNATSSARLAARYPQSGGTYVYGRERLGAFWGYLAGWGFVVGKTASCAAMALTVGYYAWPAHAHVIAVVTVAGLTAINYVGVQKSALLTRVIVAVVLAVLGAVVVIVFVSGTAEYARIRLDGRPAGVLEAAGILFFAFAGYARIATLGEEVRDPARTIPRAIPLALGITLLVYAAVAVAALAVLGSDGLAHSSAPLADAVRAAGTPGFEPVVRAGAAIASIGSLLALILGVSRTTLAMARDHHLPHGLSAVHPRFKVPHRAELAVGVVVAIIAAFADLRGAIGFSSFAVLVYYAVANASAWTLGRRIIPAVGLTGCVVLAFALPVTAVLSGLAVLVLGAAIHAIRSRLTA